MKNVKWNVKKSIGIIFISIVLLAICCFFVFLNFRQYVDVSLFNNDVIYYAIKVFMFFALVFFGFGTLIHIRNLIFYRNKIIEINDEYLIDKSSYVAGGKILYTEIEKIYIRGAFLCIKLRDEKTFLKKQNYFKQLLMVLNKKMKYEYITISDGFLDSSIYEIGKMIKENLDK